MKFHRYSMEKVLRENKYNIFDTQEERNIAENLNKIDAELIVTALNYFKEC